MPKGTTKNNKKCVMLTVLETINFEMGKKTCGIFLSDGQWRAATRGDSGSERRKFIIFTGSRETELLHAWGGGAVARKGI